MRAVATVPLLLSVAAVLIAGAAAVPLTVVFIITAATLAAVGEFIHAAGRNQLHSPPA
jgi:hypothetical protein